MTSEERVLAAFRFEKPDRIPVMDQFWAFPDSWRQRLGDPADLTDIVKYIPDETILPSAAGKLKEEDGWIYEVDGWGRTARRRQDAYFTEVLRAPLEGEVDIDGFRFESPELDSRYLRGGSPSEFEAWMKGQRAKYCVFVKTGGPYLRTTFARGETQFLLDMAGDPPLAKALADRIGDHITAVGVEALRRSGLHETGIWIYDDMAHNGGPMFGPGTFEQVLLPAYRRMIRAYRDAGAKYVLLHSDGDIRPILDMLIDAGIDGLNPVERRAGMNMADLRSRDPSLILTGGMCNSDTLVNGPVSRIEAEALEIIDLGREGGVVIGTHSISPEVPLENYVAYRRVCATYGIFGR